MLRNILLGKKPRYSRLYAGIYETGQISAPKGDFLGNHSGNPLWYGAYFAMTRNILHATLRLMILLPAFSSEEFLHKLRRCKADFFSEDLDILKMEVIS